MGGHRAFLQQFRLQTSGMGWSPAERRRQLAEFAKETRDRLIAEGRASLSYETFVNGREGALEEEVRLPGPILYRFEYLGHAAAVGLELLKKEAPVLSGRYREHFFAMVDGRPVQELGNLPTNSEAILTNDEPYSRKIQVGGQKTSVPPYLFDRVGETLQRRFGDLIYVKVKFIRLHGGYSLRRQGYRPGNRKPRPDVQAGDEMTYPALLLTRQF